MKVPETKSIVPALALSLLLTTTGRAFTFLPAPYLHHTEAQQRQQPKHGKLADGQRRRRRPGPPSSSWIAFVTEKSRNRQPPHLALSNTSNDADDDVDLDAGIAVVDVDDDTTEQLLNKARRLREEISAIESSKLQAQNEKDVQRRLRQAEEEAARQQKENLRLRYSAVVPILKDMGEEVMERVDFPPRLKGGECGTVIAGHAFIMVAYFVCISIVHLIQGNRHCLSFPYFKGNRTSSPYKPHCHWVSSFRKSPPSPVSYPSTNYLPMAMATSRVYNREIYSARYQPVK